MWKVLCSMPGKEESAISQTCPLFLKWATQQRHGTNCSLMDFTWVLVPCVFCCFSHCFPILARAFGIQLWGLWEHLAHPEGVGLVSEKKPKQVPVTRPSQCWEPWDQIWFMSKIFALLGFHKTSGERKKKPFSQPFLAWGPLLKFEINLCNSSCAFSMALRPLAIFLPLPRDEVCSP